MDKKVWVLMESWNEECQGVSSMGYVNSIYEDYNEAVRAQGDLMGFNKKNFPKDFYACWIVERLLHYAK